MGFDLARDGGVLERTPRVVRAMLEGVDDSLTLADYGPGTWSAHQILGHLIFGDQTDWIPRARLILAGDPSVVFEPFDRAGHDAMCREKPLGELLDDFDSVRAERLDDLRGLELNPAQLEMRGVHPALGEATLGELLCAWVCHDLHHIGHIAKAIAHQHKRDVGPWTAYLSILDPPKPR